MAKSKPLSSDQLLVILYKSQSDNYHNNKPDLRLINSIIRNKKLKNTFVKNFLRKVF